MPTGSTIATDATDRIRAAASGHDRKAEAHLTGPAPLAAESIHAVRVLVKRLRALWRAVEPGIGRTARRVMERPLREVHRRLGDLRRPQVLDETLRLLAERNDGKDRDALLVLHRTLTADQGRGRGGDPPLDPATLVAVFARDAVAWTAEVAWAAADFADGIRLTYRRGRRRARRYLDGGDAIDLHAWRTSTKRLLYQLDAIDAGGDLSHRREGLAKLGSLLGRRHDLAELLAILRADDGPAIDRRNLARGIDVIRHRDRQLHQRCQRLHGELFRAKPRKFMAGLTLLFDGG
jgi:CHAD domain-containing protein